MITAVVIPFYRESAGAQGSIAFERQAYDVKLTVYSDEYDGQNRTFLMTRDEAQSLLDAMLMSKTHFAYIASCGYVLWSQMNSLFSLM